MAVCPKRGIVISAVSNRSGYFPAKTTEGQCTGCAMCAIICPEAVIEVYREDDTEGKPKEKKSKPISIKGKA